MMLFISFNSSGHTLVIWLLANFLHCRSLIHHPSFSPQYQLQEFMDVSNGSWFFLGAVPRQILSYILLILNYYHHIPSSIKLSYQEEDKLSIYLSSSPFALSLVTCSVFSVVTCSKFSVLTCSAFSLILYVMDVKQRRKAESKACNGNKELS